MPFCKIYTVKTLILKKKKKKKQMGNVYIKYFTIKKRLFYNILSKVDSMINGRKNVTYFSTWTSVY